MLSVAACGLFERDQLGLKHLMLDPEETWKTVVMWGGASAVGSNGVQVAVAGGYEVLATASPKNFEYVRKLSASGVFDYISGTVVEDLALGL